ncbi:hypothetical protein [Burkholderia gladioli]|uniref:hypothetical protein n=1 Tax=Burkholderia gladioli TaxID=28095 RepID=UPI003D19CC7F
MRPLSHTERAPVYGTARWQAEADAAGDAHDLQCRVAATKILPHELYDLLDERPKTEKRLFELLAKRDDDANLKEIGLMLWNLFDYLVMQEVRDENDRLAHEVRVKRRVRLGDEL